MKRVLSFATIITILYLGACTPDTWIDDHKIDNKKGEMRLSVQVVGSQTEPATRSTAVQPIDGESDAGNIYLLFFEQQADSTGLFVNYVKVPPPTAGWGAIALPNPVNGLTSNQTDVKQPGHTITGSSIVTAITPSAAYNILAVANLDATVGDSNQLLYLDGYSDTDIDHWMTQWVGKTEKEVMQQAMFSISGSSHLGTEDYKILPNKIPMFARIVKKQNEYDIIAKLTRNVSRFDVFSENYEVLSVEIWNAFPMTSPFGTATPDYATTSHIERFYGSVTPTTVTDAGPPVKKSSTQLGGLYVFENQVVAPKLGDKMTTCLLLQITNKKGAPSWYRADVFPQDEGQALKKNMIYQVRVRELKGDGYATREDAYESKDGSQLDFVINYWDLGDEGMIMMDKDGTVLAIPNKVIRVPAAGGTVTNSILVVNPHNHPYTLEILSETYSDGALSSTLLGNKLDVNGKPLPINRVSGEYEGERTGELVIKYGTLEAKVKIVQSANEKKYLWLTLPTGNLQRLSSFLGQASDEVLVTASDPWTAKIIMEGTRAFSFTSDWNVNSTTSTNPGNPLLGEPLVKINSANPDHTSPPAYALSGSPAYIINEALKIHTYDSNPSTNTLQTGFLVVSLNGYEEEFTVVARITQSPSGILWVMPFTEHDPNENTGPAKSTINSLGGVNPNTGQLIFDGFPNLVTPGGLAFGETKLYIGTSEGTSPGTYAEWDWEFYPIGSGTKTHQYFDVVAGTWDGTTESENYLKIVTMGDLTGNDYSDDPTSPQRDISKPNFRGINISGANRTADINIFLKDDPSKQVTVKLTQGYLITTFTVVGGTSWATDPARAPTQNVTNRGGYNEYSVAVTSSNSATVYTPQMDWKVVSLNSELGTAATTPADNAGKRLANHKAKLLKTNNYYDSVNEMVEGDVVSCTQKLFHVYPKVYYPNRGVTDIEATGVLRVRHPNGAEIASQNLTLRQDPLMPRDVRGRAFMAAATNAVPSLTTTAQNDLSYLSGIISHSSAANWTNALFTIPGYAHNTTQFTWLDGNSNTSTTQTPANNVIVPVNVTVSANYGRHGRLYAPTTTTISGLPTEVTYLHTGANIQTAINGTRFPWLEIRRWRDENRGILVITAAGNGRAGLMSSQYGLTGTDTDSPVRETAAGYKSLTLAQYGNNNNNTSNGYNEIAAVYDGHSTKKVYQFVRGTYRTEDATAAAVPGPPALPVGTMFNNWNGVATTNWRDMYFMDATGAPQGTVLLVSRRSAGTSNAPVNSAPDDRHAVLIVDPMHGFIFIGHTLLFGNASVAYEPGTNPNHQLLDNLMYYIGNAAKYGSNFTDMFLDNNADALAGGTINPGGNSTNDNRITWNGMSARRAVPAPWDAVWDNSGVVGGTDNRGVPVK